MTLRVLILGGTSEGRRLAEQLASDARFSALLSFAGRTLSLQRPSVPHRIGGFGGAEGLAEFLLRERFDALVDATHAFAARISANAVAASAISSTPLVRLARVAWPKRPDDLWTDVPSMEAAAQALGKTPRRVFLSVGRLELSAFTRASMHSYLIRAIDPFPCDLPHSRVIAARGPFALDDELALLARERIELLVSKNSGTPATYAKIEAARQLGLPVIMVAQPAIPPAHEVDGVAGAVAWLGARHDALTKRGV